MNKHLESAVKRHKQEKEVNISPISKADAQVIWQLIAILGKYKAVTVRDILKNYKYLKDEDVLDLLVEWNDNNPNDIVTGEDEIVKVDDFRRKFIDMNGGILELWLVKSADPDDYYNYSKKRMEYRIVINKGLPENAAFADKIYAFKTAELRDERLETLKDNMKSDIIIL